MLILISYSILNFKLDNSLIIEKLNNAIQASQNFLKRILIDTKNLILYYFAYKYIVISRNNSPPMNNIPKVLSI